MVIRARRGATLSIARQFTRDGAPVNLTGVVIAFAAKWRISDPPGDAKISKTATVLDAAGGFYEVLLSTSETLGLEPGDYVYDIKATEPNGIVSIIEDGALVMATGVAT